MSRFASMGCDVVVEGASPAELERIRELFEERDAVFSRFRPDSELNRVNAAGGAALASPLFARMVDAALWARDTTGGLVDPTLGAALETAGYDRDFDSLNATGAAPTTPPPHGKVALYGRVLLLGPGTKLDLNGVVKAAAVDDALGFLTGPGFVSAGGDLATRGSLDIALPGGGAACLWRPRDERPHQAALAPRRRGAASPDRSRDRAPVDELLGRGHGLRRDLSRGRRRRQGCLPARRRRP